MKVIVTEEGDKVRRGLVDRLLDAPSQSTATLPGLSKVRSKDLLGLSRRNDKALQRLAAQVHVHTPLIRVSESFRAKYPGYLSPPGSEPRPATIKGENEPSHERSNSNSLAGNLSALRIVMSSGDLLSMPSGKHQTEESVLMAEGRYRKLLERHKNQLRIQAQIVRNVRMRVEKLEREQTDRTEKLRETLANEYNEVSRVLKPCGVKIRTRQRIMKRKEGYYHKLWGYFHVEGLSVPKNAVQRFIDTAAQGNGSVVE